MKKVIFVMIMFLLAVQCFAESEEVLLEEGIVVENVASIVIEESELEGIEFDEFILAEPALPKFEMLLGGFCEPFIMLNSARTFGIAYGIEFSFRNFISNWFALNAYSRLNIGAYKLFGEAFKFSRDVMFPTIARSWELGVNSWLHIFNGEHPVWEIFNYVFLFLPAVIGSLIPIVWTPIVLVVCGVAFLSPVNIGLDAEFHLYRNSFIDTFLAAGISTDPAKINYTGNPLAKNNEGAFLPIWPMMNVKAGAQLNLSHFSLHVSVAFETTLLALFAVFAGLDNAIANGATADPTPGSNNDTKSLSFLDICDVSFLIGATYRF